MRAALAARPVVLTIAGSDSSGGAGVLADLRTIERHGCHGAAVITAVTAQTPGRVLDVEPVPIRVLESQLKATLTGLPVSAVKVGLLPTAAHVQAVAEALGRATVPVIIDPVAVASDGSALADPDVLPALLNELLPLSALVTPNALEVAALLGRATPTTANEQLTAARQLYARTGAAVLVKGGHVSGPRVVDVLADADGVAQFAHARVNTPFPVRGTGCILSSAIACRLTVGLRLRRAIRGARAHLRYRLLNAHRSGNDPVAIA
ncbi:MAG TPA: bifunctional hydroxymethylpyrimidine kinase/phosphomethylpyrimidine kinase [Armatimonadota bacterium]|nr:bifunctional hydroxymethylpyrimidine kinase/phosphomethylpyrimidine kinase [Armatimonadota bacterium]HQK92399.1 bifunctional hydroxymethylpyrimidine kinase/phosphomethylpyrimidine kinase [Armatimonadota bacterium]